MHNIITSNLLELRHLPYFEDHDITLNWNYCKLSLNNEQLTVGLFHYNPFTKYNYAINNNLVFVYNCNQT